MYGIKQALILSFVVAVSILGLPRNLPADIPQRVMANLQIEDQGSRLIVSWHFFYFLLPQQFVLHEKNDEPIALLTTDTHLLEKNLTDVVQAAFDLKVDGQTVQPTLLSLTCYPNKSCLVTMSFPGRTGGKVELRAPVLQYFPPGYFLSVSVSGSAGSKGYFFGKQFPPVVHFEQADVPSPLAKAFFSKDQVAEFSAAWVNYNWILTSIVLLLIRQLRLIAVLIATIVVSWILLSFAFALCDYKLPFKIPEMVLCVPTVLLCIMGVKNQSRMGWLVLITAVAGLLNAGYDIQQIPLSASATTLNALVGLALGFAGGMALVLLVLIPLWWEFKKYPGFQEYWAPKISWGVAALAVLLPLQKLLFG